MYVMKRKHVILISFLILIMIAGYLNWSYEENQVESTINSIEENNIDEEICLEESDIKIKESTETESEDVEVESEDSSIEVVEAFSGGYEDYFMNARLKRDDARSESVYLLNQMAENDNLPEETRKKAQNELLLFADLVNKEAIIENLIIAKGFSDAVVFINKDLNVSVVVNTDELNEKRVAQITDIIKTELQIDASKIKIMESIK